MTYLVLRRVELDVGRKNAANLPAHLLQTTKTIVTAIEGIQHVYELRNCIREVSITLADLQISKDASLVALENDMAPLDRRQKTNIFGLGIRYAEEVQRLCF